MTRPAPFDVPKRVGLLMAGGTVAAEQQAGSGLIVVPEAQESNGLIVLTVGRDPVDDLIPNLVSKGLPDGTELFIMRPFTKLSENNLPEDWLTIAAQMRMLYEQYDVSTFAVAHGTDTMTATGAALSFLVSDLPIVAVTSGSNDPATSVGSDAPTNLADAAVAAVALRQWQLFGSYISFSGIPGRPSLVHLASRARKVMAYGNGFDSPNGRPVAMVSQGRMQLFPGPFIRERNLPRRVFLEPAVSTVHLEVGKNLAFEAEKLKEEGQKGVVVVLYASSTGPNGGGKYSLAEFAAKCGPDIVVVGTVENPTPLKQKGTYETTRSAEDGGLVLADRTLPEIARIKLMWALANLGTRAEVEHLMEMESIAGEISRPPVPEIGKSQGASLSTLGLSAQ